MELEIILKKIKNVIDIQNSICYTIYSKQFTTMEVVEMENVNTVQITSPLFRDVNIIEFPQLKKTPKLKKDGTPKNIICNKKKGRKSEVYAIEIPDIKKLMDYFCENEMWQNYLIFVLSCNMARRISDTLMLTWEHFFYPSTGVMRSDLLEIIEDKTDKLANPHINSACKKAICLYIEKTGINPSDNGYKNYVFVQTSGNYKGRVITNDGYRKGLKKAAVAVGIEYNIGTHSPRKTFGMISRMLHPNDYDSMELLQTIYNHSDTKTTNRYIGLTKKKVDTYYEDMGYFFDEYITGGNTYTEVATQPVVNIDTNALRDIIKEAYKAGAENVDNADPVVHIEAINKIMNMIEKVTK